MFIFQHGEEVLPGGARDIIGNVFFQTHLPEWIIALHAEPTFRSANSVSVRVNIWPREMNIHHLARSGRTRGLTRPLDRPDPDRFPYRRGSPADYQPECLPFLPTVLTFGNFRCHSMMNIIPKEVRLEGTFRTFDETLAPGGLKPVSAG